MHSSKFASYFGGIGHALSARDYRIYWQMPVKQNRVVAGTRDFHVD